MRVLEVALVDPSFPVATSSAEGELINEIRGKCGYVVNGIDWVCRKIGLPSPIEAIFDPICGDFSAVDAMAINWETMARSLDQVSGNYAKLAEALPHVWTGEDAAAALARLVDFAEATGTQSEGAALISDALEDMLVAVKAAVEFLAELLSLVDELVLKLLASPIGIAAEILKGGKTVRRIITLVNRAIDLIDKLKEIVPPVLQALALLSAMMKGTRILFQIGNFATNTNAGLKADDVAEAGY